MDDCIALMAPNCTVEAGYRAYLSALETADECANINFGSVLRDVEDDFASFVLWFDQLRHGLELPAACLSQHVYWLVRGGHDVLGESQLTHFTEGRYAIGYVIHPLERLNGYGTRLLALTLAEARRQGATHVQISCRSSNIASAKVIQHNGGRLIDEIISPRSGQALSRYQIDLAGGKEA